MREALYRDAKKLAKKAVAVAKNNAYERLYQKQRKERKMCSSWRGPEKRSQGT